MSAYDPKRTSKGLPLRPIFRESWDVKNKKWFFVTPPDVTNERILPGDPLHWTGIAQNWNTTCADCHSTNVHKNYDPKTNTYKTSWHEINVSCEECHGPGSVHVDLANAVVAVLGSEHWLRAAGAEREESQGAAGDVREVPFAAVPGARGLSAGTAFPELLRAGRAGADRCIRPTGRFWMKCTSTIRFCRARCTRITCSAPIATIRIR